MKRFWNARLTIAVALVAALCGCQKSCLETNNNDKTKNIIYTVNLAEDPAAVPDIHTQSTARATLTLKEDNSMELSNITWNLTSENGSAPGTIGNLIIGMHIHVGDSHTNGGILYGFCGGNGLPAFSQACPQGSVREELSAVVNGMVCNSSSVGNKIGVCSNTKGDETLASAAKQMRESPADSFYFNLHTQQSLAGNAHALGFIRGQLKRSVPR